MTVAIAFFLVILILTARLISLEAQLRQAKLGWACDMQAIHDAAANCIRRWVDFPSDYGWCCHHDLEMEPVFNPFNRIAYILANKPPNELLVRLENFRPVLSLTKEQLESETQVTSEQIHAAHLLDHHATKWNSEIQRLEF